jgi:putative inorganic carbon (HCO3(-)) transporter
MQRIGAKRLTDFGARTVLRLNALRTVPARKPNYRSDCSGSGLGSLRPSLIWQFMKRQPLSFWFVLIYLFFEYVRPQQIYERILGPPYARIAIILALFAFVFEQRRFRFRTPDLLLAVFSVVVLLSSVTAFEPAASYGRITDYFSWVVIYLLIANAVDTEGRFLVFTLSFLLYSFKMSNFATRSWAQDGFVYRDWGTTGAPGFFQNSGEFGIQMCIFIPLVVAFILALRDNWPRWMRWLAWGMAATAVTGIVGSSSRGALVGLAAVVLWFLMKTRHRFRAVMATIVLAGFVYAITPPEEKIRFEQMGQDKTSINRTTYWKHGLEIMENYPILGIGYANWPQYYEINYGVQALPHNIFIEAGAELGCTGLAAFLALIGCTFVLNRRTRKLAQGLGERGRFMFYMAHGLDGALVGFMASGFFVTVLYYPFFWINFGMTVALNNAARSDSGQKRFKPTLERRQLRDFWNAPRVR